MLSSIKNGFIRVKNELLDPPSSPNSGAGDASSAVPYSINLALVLATPDAPPKSQFESPQGLVRHSPNTPKTRFFFFFFIQDLFFFFFFFKF